MEDVRLLEAACRDGPREAPSTYVPARVGASAAAFGACVGAPALVGAGKGRALRLQGLEAFLRRATRPLDEGGRIAPVVPQVASTIVEA